MSVVIVTRHGTVVLRLYKNGSQREIKVGPDTPENRKKAEESAAKIRLEERAGIQPESTLPTLAEFAKRYLEEDVGHLAETTRKDRPFYLGADGLLVGPLGHHRIDELVAPILRSWWSAKVERGGLSPQTGRHYLTVLNQVLGYARELGLAVGDPVAELRALLRRRTRTKQGRAGADPAQRIRPIEEPGQIAALLAACAATDKVVHLFALLALDAGLRVGEAIGLRWRGVSFGADDDDTTRHLYLDERSNRPRGGLPDAPKSGRTREVQMSRRLRRALLAWRLEMGRPKGDDLVLGEVDPSNLRRRPWARAIELAKIGERDPKDLRDTYASQLLSAGVALGYISQQLGHANPQVTAEHYARWIPKGYREPMALRPGEVPADLLARLGERPAVELGQDVKA